MLHDEECYSISYLKYVTSTLGYRDKKKIFCVCSNAGPIGQHLYSDRILLVSSDDFTIAARRVDHQDIHQSNMQCNARCAKIDRFHIQLHSTTQPFNTQVCQTVSPFKSVT